MFVDQGACDSKEALNESFFLPHVTLLGEQYSLFYSPHLIDGWMDE
jgi:hypothetical protein